MFRRGGVFGDELDQLDIASVTRNAVGLAACPAHAASNGHGMLKTRPFSPRIGGVMGASAGAAPGRTMTLDTSDGPLVLGEWLDGRSDTGPSARDPVILPA